MTSEGDYTTKISQSSVPETVERLTTLLTARGMKIFVVIDQAVEAREVGLDLSPTTLVIFGNPLAGTAVMRAAPLSAIDLPLKILIWSDDGQTKVTYLSPSALARRHDLSVDIAKNLAGIDPLTDALVAD